MKKMVEIDFQEYPLQGAKLLELQESQRGKRQKLLRKLQVSRYQVEKSIKAKGKPIENKEDEIYLFI